MFSVDERQEVKQFPAERRLASGSHHCRKIRHQNKVPGFIRRLLVEKVHIFFALTKTQKKTLTKKGWNQYADLHGIEIFA